MGDPSSHPSIQFVKANLLQNISDNKRIKKIISASKKRR
jgi:hypothetical protein